MVTVIEDLFSLYAEVTKWKLNMLMLMDKTMELFLSKMKRNLVFVFNVQDQKLRYSGMNKAKKGL